MLRKAVFYVDNLSPLVEVEDLQHFVAGMGVRVVSCYGATPRRTAEDKLRGVKDLNRHAFRLCINRADKAIMMKADSWPEDVIIKRWYFQKKDDGDDDDGHRTGSDGGGRVAGDEPTDNALLQQQIQQIQQQQQQQAAGTDVAGDSAGSIETSMDHTSSSQHG